MFYYILLFYIISIPISSYILLKNDDEDYLFEAFEDFFNQMGPSIKLE